MKLNVTDVGFMTEEPLSLSDYGCLLYTSDAADE